MPCSPEPWKDDRLAANGEKIRNNFKSWFKDSKVVDRDGAPQIWYHATLASFDEFAVGDVGFHFGSIEQAAQRMGKILEFQEYECGQREGGENIIPVYLSIQNPLFMDDVGDWDNPEIVSAFVTDMIAQSQTFAAAYDLAISELSPEPTFTEIFEKMGYDGIVYENIAEGRGHDSWIAFRADQVKSAVGNCGLYLKNSKSLTDLESEKLVFAAQAALDCIKDRQLSCAF